MKLFYGITHEDKRDIQETEEGFKICRRVIWSEETLENKEQRLKEIPFCSVLDSLERELKARVNNILDHEDDNCMNDLDWLNMD